MHPVPKLTEGEYKRLQIAKQTGKYGHLESWKELYLFQRMIATPKQIKEIGLVAKRKNKGERVTLPLKDYIAFSSLS